MSDTPNIPQTFESLDALCESFGASLIERTRITFSADVLKLTAEVKPVDGRVLVITDTRGTELISKLTADAMKRVRVIDATKVPAKVAAKVWRQRVRGNVMNGADSRGVKLTATPWKLGSETLGYSFHRS